jgi:uncharacterized protein
MKLRTAVIAGLLCAAGPALAQSPAASTPPAAPQHATLGQPAPAKPESQAPPTLEKIDPAKEAAIRHLMDITETSKMGDSMAAYLTNQVHTGVGRALPQDQVPKFMDSFTQKFKAGVPPTAVNDAIVAIYAKHFSLEEIQALIKFYESPIGVRVVKEMPEMDEQMRTAGQQIEFPAALAVLRGMTDEYPQLKQMLPPDSSAPTPSSAPAASPASPAPAAKSPAAPSTLKPVGPQQ